MLHSTKAQIESLWNHVSVKLRFSEMVRGEGHRYNGFLEDEVGTYILNRSIKLMLVHSVKFLPTEQHGLEMRIRERVYIRDSRTYLTTPDDGSGETELSFTISILAGATVDEVAEVLRCGQRSGFSHLQFRVIEFRQILNPSLDVVPSA